MCVCVCVCVYVCVCVKRCSFKVFIETRECQDGSIFQRIKIDLY